MSALYRIQWGCSYFVQNIILLLLYHDFLNKLFNLLGLNFPSFNVYVSRTAAVAAAKLLQLCPTLCDPIDGSPLGSLVPGILQARILEWVAISFSRGSSRPRDWIRVSCIAGRFFTHWAMREVYHLKVVIVQNCPSLEIIPVYITLSFWCCFP